MDEARALLTDVKPYLPRLMVVAGGLLLAFLFTFACGHLYISWMNRRKVSQVIGPDVPSSHQAKEGTPTGGGIFMLSGMSSALLLLGRISQPYVYIPLVAVWTFSAIGMTDDLLKLVRKDGIGLTSTRKLAMQVLASALVYWLLATRSGLQSTLVTLPWDPGVSWDMGLKAQGFMGDSGSLPLGVLMAVCALLLKVELVVIAAAGIFVWECTTSFIQIVSIRIFHRKVFVIAPVHHAFEIRGMQESKIVARFQIASMVCSVAAGLLFMVKYL